MLSFYLFYLYNQKKMKHENEIEKIKYRYEKSILDVELEIQEQVLENISREIHDNIGLSLTLAKLNLNTVDDISSSNTKEKINHSVELITSAIQDLRNLSQSMNADLIRNNGLIKTLEHEIIRINRSVPMKVRFIVTGESTFMDTQKELLLFRILQEGMNNIIKHAEATEAYIGLEYGKETLKLHIADNGKGFEMQRGQRTSGSGLSNMKARANMLNGTWNMESGENGTTLTFIIPYS